MPYKGPIRGIISCISTIESKFVFFLPGDTLLIGREDIDELTNKFLKTRPEIATFLINDYGAQLLSFLCTTKWLKQAIGEIEKSKLVEYRNIRITDLYRVANKILFLIYENNSKKLNQFTNINDQNTFQGLKQKLEIIYSKNENHYLLDAIGTLLIYNDSDVLRDYNESLDKSKLKKERFIQTKWPSDVFNIHINKDLKLLSI